MFGALWLLIEFGTSLWAKVNVQVLSMFGARLDVILGAPI